MKQPVDKKSRFRISLRSLTVLGFGGLVALSVGSVLVMSVLANFTNTFALLNRQAVQLIAGMERSILDESDQAERSVNAIARLYANGAIEISGTAASNSILQTLLLSTRVVEIYELRDRQGNGIGLARRPNGRIVKVPIAPRRDLAREGAVRQRGARRSRPRPVWSEPVVRHGVLYHEVSQVLKRDGKVDGVVRAAIGGHTINRITSALGRNNETTAFVLDEEGAVIAHSRQPRQFRGRNRIALADFPDEVLKLFRQADELDAFAEGLASKKGVSVAEATTASGNEHFIFITKQFTGLTEKPYTLGAYFSVAVLGGEVRRAVQAATLGFALLVIAVAAAIVFASYLSNPLRSIARTTSRFANLELQPFQPLPRSKVREIDDQTQAINAMHTALTEFSHYVPKELVRGLLASGHDATRSEERDITVMFTDIAGFTAMSEKMSEAEVVELLNENFEVICQPIGTCRGTVDKFMGDGLMAFWGAPEADPEHARHALEAAAEIANAVARNNAFRRAKGLPALNVRIGVHSGKAVVGNIGGGDRHNYTVIGDTVNVANRLEQTGKEMDDWQDAVVVVSSECQRAAGDFAGLRPAGRRRLRGRSEPVEIFTYVPKVCDPASAVPARHNRPAKT